MKTIGEQAKAFRESRGWSVKEMAAACKTSRQNIETLESKGDRTPRYIKELARAMGTTVDVLMEGRYRPGAGQAGGVLAAEAAELPPVGDVLLQALNVVAAAISNADELTRVSIEPLLSRLAQRPQESGQIARKLHEELSGRTVRNERGETEFAGQLFGLDVRKMEQSGQRISTAAQGRKGN